MRILIIEDEKKTSAYLRKGLSEHGFTVETAAEGEAGLRTAMSGAFDLMILDVMLPERDGWSVLSELRQSGKQTPVLFLTARDAIHDRVKGLRLGADDYLVKPFAFSELLARIDSILRRTSAHQREGLQIGDLELDLVHHKAVRAARRLDLTPKEFALLALLARRTGQVLSRSLIALAIWGVSLGSETNVVDVHVCRLRS